MVRTIVKGRLGEIWSRRSFDQSLSCSLLTNLFQLRFEGIIKQKKRGLLKFRNEESDGMRSVTVRRPREAWCASMVLGRERWFEQTLAGLRLLPFPAILLFSNPNYIFLNNLAKNRPSLFFLTVLIFSFLIFNF